MFEGLTEDQSDEITDSLLHADAWTGGAPGITGLETYQIMESVGLLGPKGGLTKRGAELAKQVQRESGWR